MVEFCHGERFWDTGLTWTNNSWPQFTDCFRYSVLELFPCVWLWVTSAPYVCYLFSQPRRHMSQRRLFLARLTLVVLLGVLHLMMLVERTMKDTVWAAELSDILWLPTLLVVVTVLALERSRGQVRSFILFSFWIFTSAILAFQLYSDIRLHAPSSSRVQFTLQCFRYGTATVSFLLSCLADEGDTKPKSDNPELSASALSWIAFAWLERLMVRGFRKPLTEADVFELHPSDKTASAIDRFMRQWVRHSPPSDASEPLTSVKNKPTFLGTLVRTFWLDLFVSHVGMVVFVAMNLFTPIILGWFVKFAENEGEPLWHGYVFALAFLVTKILITIFNTSSQFLAARMAVRVRSTAIAAIFRKALSLSSQSRRELSMGEIVNLM
ncbi:putative ATP-binding cassette sub-family C member 13, partial [Aplysia californica]|uniref:ATP-binding cassette sub-family C member 13 n=1 Tax=Aplysia californica TaxID=6500 RepID=A0ABM1AC30_APLCA